MIQGAIFDADGTLLDSMGMWDTVGERYLASLGVTARPGRSEERRVGKECRSRWSPYH